MTFEHLLQEKFPYVTTDGVQRELDGLDNSDTEKLPIYEILRFMTHEKFILSGMVVLGIGKLLIVLTLFG